MDCAYSYFSYKKNTSSSLTSRLHILKYAISEIWCVNCKKQKKKKQTNKQRQQNKNRKNQIKFYLYSFIMRITKKKKSQYIWQRIRNGIFFIYYYYYTIWVEEKTELLHFLLRASVDGKTASQNNNNKVDKALLHFHFIYA